MRSIIRPSRRLHGPIVFIGTILACSVVLGPPDGTMQLIRWLGDAEDAAKADADAGTISRLSLNKVER